MVASKGLRGPETRRGGRIEGTLRVDHPILKTALAGDDLDCDNITEVLRWGNARAAEVALWQLGRPRSHNVRLDKRGAHFALRNALRALAAGGDA